MEDFEEFTIPLDETSIAGYVALTGETVNEQDAYHLQKGSPYTISRAFDEKSGYRTKSMLVVPMKDHQDVVIGVVQLINKKRDPAAVLQSASLVDDQVISFTSVDRNLVESLASQAAVAFENADLIERIRKLFDDFVHAAVSAVELRDPHHLRPFRRVAELTCALAEKVDAGPPARTPTTGLTRGTSSRSCATPPSSTTSARSRSRRRSSARGRSSTPRRRSPSGSASPTSSRTSRPSTCRPGSTRFESGHAGADQLAAIDDEYAQRRDEAARVLKAVLSANEPTVVEEENFSALMNLPARRFSDHDAEDVFPVEDWAQEPHLSAEEIEALSIRKGTLTTSERAGDREPRLGDLQVPAEDPVDGRAAAHPRDRLGPPREARRFGLPASHQGAEIPVQSRVMTIADIYDALRAVDRPYKKAVSVERALEILQFEARDGKLDQDLLSLFLDAKIYRAAGLPEPAPAQGLSGDRAPSSSPTGATRRTGRRTPWPPSRARSRSGPPSSSWTCSSPRTDT